MREHDEGLSLAADTEQKRIRHTGLFANQLADNPEQSEEIDFKMVTFSLAGKEYGIDIMMVKEIAKFGDFTYVPNTSSFVSGVYNLRGDIISVIDMRRLFNLPVAEKVDSEPQDGLILRLDSGLIGVVVDSIDKVVGIASENIQDPHPIFADINLKYISGVVEHEQELYIILDAERVLGVGSAAATGPRRDSRASAQQPAATGSPQIETVDQPGLHSSDALASAQQNKDAEKRPATAQVIENLSQTLAAVSGFYVSDVNREWALARVDEWTREGRELSLASADDCAAFLESFSTPDSNRLWTETEIDAAKTLFAGLSGPVQVWNPGCGDGYEAYSLACVLHTLYADQRIKIFASDNDLLRVSTAASLRLDRRSVPAFYEPFLVEGVSAVSFSEEISGTIIFEFSEIAHTTSVPPVSVVVIRDELSFLPVDEQARVVGLIAEQIKRPGIVVSGRNEDLSKLIPCRASNQGTFRAWTLE